MVVRQARSEATRRKIIDAAVELFDDVGYTRTGLGDIIEHAAVTKGALYHHFSSKEALGVAIIGEGSEALLKIYTGISRSPAPALEAMIHGVLVIEELAKTDKLVRVGTELLRIFVRFSEASTLNYSAWLAEIRMQTRRAQAEGDLRADLDADTAGEIIVSAMLGTELISDAVSGGEDLLERITRTWELLLEAIASEQSLPYLREYLARASLRRGDQAMMID